jgi:hypothetical protein
MAVGQGKLGSTLELLIAQGYRRTDGRTGYEYNRSTLWGGIEVYVVSEERRYSVVYRIGGRIVGAGARKATHLKIILVTHTHTSKSHVICCVCVRLLFLFCIFLISTIFRRSTRASARGFLSFPTPLPSSARISKNKLPRSSSHIPFSFSRYLSL